MVSNPCAPTPTQSVIDNPCAMLSVLRGALYDLMTGKARSQVRFGENWLSFHNGNIKELRAEIRMLETMCLNGQPSNAGRATQVGRFNPALASYGFGRNCY